MNKTLRNILYYGLYQVLLPLSSIIVQRKVTGVLPPEEIGKYAFTSLIAGFFTLIVVFELNKYGVNQIAKTKTKEERTKVFNELYFMQIIIGFITLAVYLVTVPLIVDPIYKTLVLIQGLTLIAGIVDIFWFYAGMEKMKNISFRNILTQVFNIVAIFLFINDPSQINLYAFIISLMWVLGNASMWLTIKKDVNQVSFKNVDKSKIKIHIQNAFKILLPHIIIYGVANIDKIILAQTSGSGELGYYSIVMGNLLIVISLISSVGIVLMPQSTRDLSNSQEHFVKRNNAFLTILAITGIILFTIVATQSNVFLITFGSQYSDTSKVDLLFKIGSLLIIFMPLSQLIVNTIIIPKNYTRLIIINSLITLLAAIFIFFISGKAGGDSQGSIFMMVAKVVVEIIYLIIFIFSVRKLDNINPNYSSIMKIIIISVITFIIVDLLNIKVIYDNNLIYTLLKTSLNSIIIVFVMIFLGYTFKIELIKSSIDAIISKVKK
jgi:O-antigen/teichoic acid export membrane protein